MDFSDGRMFSGGIDYQLDSDTDSEKAQSSEDEIDQFLHGTPEQKRRIRRRSLGKQSSSEDEFEKEMELELNATMKNIQQSKGSTTGTAAPAGFYDDAYFDSDSDENEKSEDKKKKKHRILSNDELLYNPQEDEENQQWVNSHRFGNQQGSKGKRSSQKAAPASDAILNCPACMTTLCVDCQRHDLYKHQYRAMFVMNCTTDTEEVLRYPKSELGKKNRRKRKHQESKVMVMEQEVTNSPTVKSLSDEKHTFDNTFGTDQSSHSDILSGHFKSASGSPTQSQNTPVLADQSQSKPVSHEQSQTASASQVQSQSTSVLHEQSQHAPVEDVYHPVRCAECKTEVGVFDSDEVYHFYNVLASYA